MLSKQQQQQQRRQLGSADKYTVTASTTTDTDTDIDDTTSSWLATVLSCFGRRQRRRSIGRQTECHGIERQLNVSRDQPQLISPMKLVLYDSMPSSPAPPTSSYRAVNNLAAGGRLSQWMSQGRDLASRASDQSRLSVTVRKKVSKQSISGPMPMSEPKEADVDAEVVSARNRTPFRPLQLSIFLPGNRLSDLPVFERIDFSSTGEIQMPAKALLRARSEDRIRSFSRPLNDRNYRPAVSMVEGRQLEYWPQHQQQRRRRGARQRSFSTTSDPPLGLRSASEGLNSHPVRWSGQPVARDGTAQAVLSPMTEETETSPVPGQGDPLISSPSTPTATEPKLPPAGIQIPYRKPITQHNSTRPTVSRPRMSRNPSSTFIPHWISRATSTSSTASYSSSSSQLTTLRANNLHRSSQFYQCAISPPLPHHHHHHHRYHHHHNNLHSSLDSASASASTSASSSLPDSPPSMTSSSSNGNGNGNSHSHNPSRSQTPQSLNGKQVTVLVTEEDDEDDNDAEWKASITRERKGKTQGQAQGQAHGQRIRR